MRQAGTSFAIVIVMAWAGGAGAAIAEYRDDNLTVHMTRTSIAECVRALESATGADIHGRIPEAGEITISLESVPLREGLGRIFGERNFTITYKRDGRPAAVEVLGGPLPALTPASSGKDRPMPHSAQLPGDEQTMAQAGATVQAFLERNPVLELDHDLAAALGKPRATFHDVLRTAADSNSKRIRSRALMLSLRTMREDADVWDAFTTVVEKVPVDSMSEFMQHTFGPHAEDTTRELVLHGDSQLRGPAKAVLERLEAQADALGSHVPAP